MLRVALRRKKSAKSHRDGAGSNFGETSCDDDMRRGNRTGDSGSQRERNSETIRHADDNIAHGLATGEMLFDVLHVAILSTVRRSAKRVVKQSKKLWEGGKQPSALMRYRTRNHFNNR